MIPKSNIPRWTIMLMDVFLSIIALFIAYLIRFDLDTDAVIIRDEWSVLSKSLFLYIGFRLVVFYMFGIQKGIIRHTSTQEIKRIILASLTCTGLYLIAGLVRYFYFDGFYLFPMSVLIIELLASVALLLGVRFTVKMIFLESTKNTSAEKKVLIYGSGELGLITKGILEKSNDQRYSIVGFIDDSKGKVGNRLQGVNVYHSSELTKIIDKKGVELLILAIAQPKKNLSKRVFDVCIERNVEINKVPSAKSWVNGSFSDKQISKININDLLGRKSIVLDKQKIKSDVKDKVILITGAAGSIGSGIVRQILKFNPQKVLLLDQAESPLYDLEIELKNESAEYPVEVVIGDIRNLSRMENVFHSFNPEIVYHAAAYKHVPLMENNPSEAILTNVKGTKNLVDLSVKYDVNKFVMVSTDKAVNPTNVMGASKRIAEIYAQASNQKGKTRFITTRFGNVLGSNGSVIPLFQRQMDAGGPVTVTDERITRFFMTIPEACQLVLEAGSMGEGGEIFVFDMGESVKIIDLAKKMIKLRGLELGKDIEIKITGLRPGEKLYEELLASEENTLETHHKQILKAKVRDADAHLLVQIDNLIELFEKQNNDDIVGKMKEIVPEFISNNSTFQKLDN